ncbi:MAG: flagellar basal body L-ring protein FlgH, partial [bacterium]
MKILWFAMGLIISAIIFTSVAGAASLWDEHNGNLFADIKARYVGDVVTILVNERTDATQRSSTEMSQEEAMESGTGTGLV